MLKASYLPLNFKGGLKGAFPYVSVFNLIAADKSPATARGGHDYTKSALSVAAPYLHVKYVQLFVSLL